MKKRALAILSTGLVIAHSTFCHSTKTTFTLPELEALKQQQKCPPDATKKISATTHGTFSQTVKIPPYEKLFWWSLFPTTGLHAALSFSPPPYPYLPHAYSLSQLAPKCGNGITVTLIDTGVFGFSLTTPTQTFTRHPNLTITGDFSCESHNTVPFEGNTSDPFKNLTTFIFNYVENDTMKNIDRLLPSWILEYLTTKTTTALDEYLQKHGSPDLFEKELFPFFSKKKLLSAEGKRFKNTVLLSEYGFSRFTLATLESGEKRVAECLPLPSLTRSASHFKDHGTHTASIIGARFLPSNTGMCGLAPHCSLRVIKALHEGTETTTDVTHITHALERAANYQTDIVNLSLKLDDTVDPSDPLFKMLEKKLNTFPYICCATGNEGTKKSGRISYPARFKMVPFSVGSFGCSYNAQKKMYSCHLSPFNQHEKGVGPLFVAPGETILGCSYAYANKEPLYALKSGTSCATAFMSGALALILGEFKNDFSREQLLAVCYASCFKLHDTIEWKEQVVYGVLDIRTALFTLHILKELKKIASQVIEKQFSSALTLIHTELFAMPNAYGKKHCIPYSFKESFIDYYNKVPTLSVKQNSESHAIVLTKMDGEKLVNDAPQKQPTPPLSTVVETLALAVHKKISFPSQQ